MRYIKIIGMVAAVVGMSACSNWLDVQPKTTVNEEQLFSREMGFKEALTGIYMQMASPSMYGRTLTYGFIDHLAQRYNDQDNKDLYTFPSGANEGYINEIWSRSYNILANINNFLSWLERSPEVLTTKGYPEIMKGEALGLRAFLYFDLLRMWGPVYQNNPSLPCIPYRTLFNREDKTLIAANEVMGYIEQDLKQAEQLLINDPMHIEFPTYNYSIGGDAFLQYRLKRMNLYAVKALLARMYLWKGDKVNAAKYAGEVINATDENHSLRFRLVTDNSTDRIYSTEIIFSLSINKFADQVKNDFLFDGGFAVQTKERVYKMFNTNEDGTNDMRIREGQGFAFSALSVYCRKFDQTGLYSFVIENTMPLIRLSEMYYIQSECEGDLGKSAAWLSQVRAARGADELNVFKDEEEKMNKLEIEYRKEFYGEGQLWYFLKRNFRKTFLDCPLDHDMTDANYRFSIPNDEVILGTIN
ncbi:MAG: RagB/SusD family nutrient uptake outer membrane protein [Odoribacter sp.]